MNETVPKEKVIFLYVVKEFAKFVLTLIIFILISGVIGELFINYYGLDEYLKQHTLRLFVDRYYIEIAPIYVNKIDEYFAYVTSHSYDNYLWSIPYCTSIIYIYISYWIAHKIVDRSGVGATKRLDFLHFFFIFGISNILARIEIFSDYTILWWYIFYKAIKIGVLKIKQKQIKQGEK